MELTELDVRGLSCPIPVLQVKNALKSHPEGLTVFIDSLPARENITRFVEANGYKTEFKELNKEWILKVQK